MEQLKESFHIAWTNLSHNAIRSLLSILGVVIGIAAVITVLSIGAGAKQRIMDQMNSLGVNVYTVRAQYDEKTKRMGFLELDDVVRLEEVPSVLSVLPQLNLYQMVRSRSGESRGLVVGVDATALGAKGYVIKKGRNMSPIEIEERMSICLISEETEQILFSGSLKSSDTSLFIENKPWEVVGVFAPRSKRRKGRGGLEVWVPLTTLMRTGQQLMIPSIDVHVSPSASPAMKTELLMTMERGDPKRKGLFSVRDQADSFSRSLEIQKSLSMNGLLVACVSLIVGGIGMMNVMLTSVAERTREIGIRRAVGARKKDILLQFLVESCLLSLLGGILGLLVGSALARGLPLLLKDQFTVIPVIQPSFLVLAVMAGVTMGMAFGFYPAIKASKLSPSEALRTE
ncbi:MAG: Macrolide export ATP-binding/permease protein MacB [Elusimicrobia bacterium]|nr:Macrolide export ATP-binding/permease protein MacB [Elusimicrobiota bacterium]